LSMGRQGSRNRLTSPKNPGNLRLTGIDPMR
jgi:hypothetical protein